MSQPKSPRSEDAAPEGRSAPFDTSFQLLRWLRDVTGAPLEDDLDPAVGCDDMDDAYHIVANRAAMLGVTVVALKLPGSFRTSASLQGRHLRCAATSAGSQLPPSAKL